jgi:hypothetical protein
MSRMSEIALEIQERLEHGEEPRIIAQSLNVPVEWVFNYENDAAEYDAWAQALDDAQFAEQMADADAEQYGIR